MLSLSSVQVEPFSEQLLLWVDHALSKYPLLIDFSQELTKEVRREHAVEERVRTERHLHIVLTRFEVHRDYCVTVCQELFARVRSVKRWHRALLTYWHQNVWWLVQLVNQTHVCEHVVVACMIKGRPIVGNLDYPACGRASWKTQSTARAAAGRWAAFSRIRTTSTSPSTSTSISFACLAKRPLKVWSSRCSCMVSVDHRDSHVPKVSGATKVEHEQLWSVDHVGGAKLCRDFWHANYSTVRVFRGQHEGQRTRQMLVVCVG